MRSFSTLVSVGIPTFNRSTLLKRSIDSILNQDYQNLEIVISDNGSTDDTSTLCQDICRQDPRVIYIRQSRNRGAVANFRTVLSKSTGELFMWFPDDYRMDSNYISSCVREFSKDLSLILVTGQGKFFKDGKFAFYCADYNCLEELPEERVISFYRQFRSDLTVFYGLMKRQAITDIFIKNRPENLSRGQGELESAPVTSIFNASLGDDVRVISELCFLGKVKTIYSVFIYREEFSSEASDVNRFRKIASRWGVPAIQGDYPYITHAVMSFADIGYHSPTYVSLGSVKRWVTAWKALQHMLRMYRLDLRGFKFRSFFQKALGNECEYKRLAQSLFQARQELLISGIKLLLLNSDTKSPNFLENRSILNQIFAWTELIEVPLSDSEHNQYHEVLLAFSSITDSKFTHCIAEMMADDLIKIGINQIKHYRHKCRYKESVSLSQNMIRVFPHCKLIYVELSESLQLQGKVLESARARLVSERML